MYKKIKLIKVNGLWPCHGCRCGISFRLLNVVMDYWWGRVVTVVPGVEMRVWSISVRR